MVVISRSSYFRVIALLPVNFGGVFCKFLLQITERVVLMNGGPLGKMMTMREFSRSN